jgi:hypothetical protein
LRVRKAGIGIEPPERRLCAVSSRSISSGHEQHDTPKRAQPDNVCRSCAAEASRRSAGIKRAYETGGFRLCCRAVDPAGPHLPSPAAAQDVIDGITGFRRRSLHVTAWPGGKKVAVSFALFVEAFGFGHGPSYGEDNMWVLSELLGHTPSEVERLA